MFIFSFLITLGLQANDLPFSISRSIYDHNKLPFIHHVGKGKYDNFLSMQLSFEPVKKLFNDILKEEKRLFQSRGEAHITVVTPVEFYNSLSSKMTIDEINKIGIKNNIQNSKFEILCLGKGQARIDQKTEENYFIVVSSETLLNIRKEIAELFYRRGGKKTDFNPIHYFPHITVAFTKRDLHESDGVIKNQKSCIRQINII